MESRHYLACDLGAESGRVIVGSLANEKLTLEEIHRFPNVPLRVDGSMHWNIADLVLQIKEGLRKASRLGIRPASVSTDSWGVDYVLFDREDAVMEPVFHYRDARTKRGVAAALAKVTWQRMFEETGIQYMPLNTAFQLAAEDPARLRQAKFLLSIGDAINYFLSGVPKIEQSMASTFQLYDPRAGSWSASLINALGFPPGIFPEIVPSGTRLGAIRSELGKELGLESLEVIAGCSHDTGAAVSGVPAVGRNWAYLSSGTWSLMGVELPLPVINEKSRGLNFTNEVGYGGAIRLLRNISGLWLIQECRRHWAQQGRELDYATLAKLAEASPAFGSLINPGSEEFLAPASMPAQIEAFCRRTGQAPPVAEGAFIRCALESLALLYRRTLRQIEELTGTQVECVHIVGGGSNNDLLNQLTANAVQVPVLAGPAEATAGGNVLIQAIALGHVPSLSAAREIVRNSTNLRRFTPQRPEAWDEAYARFERLLQSDK